MPIRDWNFRVTDILNSIEKIQRYISGLNFESFCLDDEKVDAVIRNLEIIAADKIPEHIQDKLVDIPWRKIKNFRNILAHEYFGIDLKIIWETIQNELESLKLNLQTLLEILNPESTDGRSQ